MNRKQKIKAQQLYELKKKNTTTAVILSLLIIGAGSMYNGKVGSGIMQLIVSLLLWMFALGWIMWFVSPFIAYSEANKHNQLLKIELDLD